MNKVKLTKYVENSLQMGAGELLARFNNEFSYGERTALAKAVRYQDERVKDIFDETSWLYDVIRDLHRYYK